MNDTYAEHLIKRKTPVSAYLINVMMVVLTLLSLFLAFTFNGFAIILFCVVSFCTYLIFRNSYVEFEYLFIDHQLTVDQIMGRSKRKTICTINMSDMQIVAPSGASELNSFRAGQSRLIDFGSHMPHAMTYTIIVNSGAKQKEVIFEPDEKMIDCMYQSAPSKVIRK